MVNKDFFVAFRHWIALESIGDGIGKRSFESGERSFYDDQV